MPMQFANSARARNSARQRGFTLIELMVVVLLMGILLGIGVPSMQTIVQDGRIAAQQRVLVGAINMARSEAIHRNQTITISHNSATAGDWSEGLRIYTDEAPGGNTAYDDSKDTLIQEVNSLGGNDITLNSDVAGNNFISFRPNGMLNEGGNIVTIAVCDDRGQSDGLAVTISLAGRADVTSTATCEP